MHVFCIISSKAEDMLTYATILFVFPIILLGQYSNTLFTADFTNPDSQTQIEYGQSFVGFSWNYNQISSIFNTTTFQSLLLNSKLNNMWSNTFYNSIKMPLGYKYNCSQADVLAGTTLTCTHNFSSTELRQIASFFYRDTYYGDIGWDMQGSDFSNPTYMSMFSSFVTAIQTSGYNYAYFNLVDYGDQLHAMGYLNRTYTALDYFADMVIASDSNNNAILGPGITQAADSTWLLNYTKMNDYGVGSIFTVRCVVFPDSSLLTINNLLSDNYSLNYLIRRFTVGSKTFGQVDFYNTFMGISDIRLTNGNGVAGISDSMAAAIWAIDISMQFAFMYGSYISFNVDLTNTSHQSPFTLSPTIKPSVLYMALMMVTLAGNNYPYFSIPILTPGLLQNVKIWGLNASDQFSVLIINKDQTNITGGQVQLILPGSNYMRCLYLTGTSLTDNVNVTFAGYKWVANNATPQGNFTSYLIKPNFTDQHKNSHYRVPLTVAQVALCSIPSVYMNIPTGTPSKNAEISLKMAVIIVILSFFMIL